MISEIRPSHVKKSELKKRMDMNINRGYIGENQWEVSGGERE
jgi:hypothetical protein